MKAPGIPEMNAYSAYLSGPVERIVITCAFCKRPHRSYTQVQGTLDDPRTGDISICDGCAEPSLVDLDQPGNCRQPNDEEMARILTIPAVRAVRALIAFRDMVDEESEAIGDE